MRLEEVCRADTQFLLAARYWTGSLRLDLGGEVQTVVLRDGVIVDESAPPGGAIAIAAPAHIWERILVSVPEPFLNDIIPAQAFGLQVSGDPETFWQYYPAVQRAIELLGKG